MHDHCLLRVVEEGDAEVDWRELLDDAVRAERNAVELVLPLHVGNDDEIASREVERHSILVVEIFVVLLRSSSVEVGGFPSDREGVDELSAIGDGIRRSGRAWRQEGGVVG